MLKSNFLVGLLLLFLSCIILVGITGFTLKNGDVIHEITIHHPGMKTDKKCLLIERQTTLDDSLAFYMDVQSVICLDGECKIVDVRLFWDCLGGYLKYELEEDVELEKKDGEPFTETDYTKLQYILRDSNSVFDGIELSEVVDVKKENGGIDGISGATVLTDATASVKGAAWTCYTLWHWVNGEVQSIIKDITGRNITTTELQDFLNEKEDRFRYFALTKLRSRQLYDSTNLHLVKREMINFDRASTKLGITYLKNAPEKEFLAALGLLFPEATDEQRILYLNALLNHEELFVESVLEELDEYIPQLKNYQELNIVLNFLEEKQITNLSMNELLIGFLKHEEFLFARRVYWFLSEQNLKNNLKIELDAFERKFEDRL